MCGKGICAKMTAAKTRTQPVSSLVVMTSPRMSQPARAAKTDSRLMMRVAVVGSVYFWPTICKV